MNFNPKWLKNILPKFALNDAILKIIKHFKAVKGTEIIIVLIR